MTKLILSSPGRALLRNGRLALAVAAAPSSGSGSGTAGAGTLSLADFAVDMTPIQRVGTSAQVRVSGTCDPALTSVQARAIIAAGGAAHTAWAAIPASAGKYDGMLTVPQGDWCKLEAADGVNTVSTTNRFGVGVIGLLIGQSNMENRPATAYKSPLGDKRSIEYTDVGTFKRLGNINDSMPANTGSGTSGYSTGLTIQTSSRGDGYVYVANLLAQNLGCIVCLVERARGGSDIIDWVGAGTAANDKWTPAADAIRAIGGDCEFALWYQGETNANAMSTATMVTHLGTLQSQCHALTGRTASNFHFGVISLGPGSFGGSSEGEFGNMRAAHVQFANNTPGAFLAGTAHDSQTSDSVHIVGESHARVGARNARALLARFGIGTPGAGPRVVSATRSGSVVTLTVLHTGGTVLLDGAGGNGAALTGFEFKDAAGNLLPYASSVASATTMQFTVTGTPATVAYAMMNNPHNTDPLDPKTAVVLASVPCDNAAVFASSYGCPLQPLAPMAITGG